MDSSRATAMQMQLRHNAGDLQDFLRDLETWESEIKEKDNSLKKQKPILKEVLPPVRSRRSQAPTSKKKTKNKTGQSGHTAKPVRITSYDYRGWDKFDVEKACEEVDYEVQSSSGSGSEEMGEDEEEEEEVLEEERKRQQALMEKDKGNALFKEGKLELAVECYTAAMGLDPLSAVIPANRALALLKLERYAAAENDCSVSLALDDGYVKAYLRRGTARTKLGKLREAKEDFMAALKLEPGNKQAKSDIVKLEKQLKMAESSSEVETQKSASPHVFAMKRPPHLRSKKPLKRIAIEEVGAEGPVDTTTLVQPEISGKTSEDPVGSSGTLGKEHDIISSEESPCDISNRVSAASSEVQDDPRREQRPSPVVSERTSQDDAASDGHHMQLYETEKAPQVPEVLKLPPVPDSCIQFQTDWKSLRRNRNVLSQYFKALPPSKYPSLFQQSLETDIFPEIISLLHQEYVKCGKLCLEELRWLTKVKRFSVAVMFLSRKEKEGLHQLFKELYGLVTTDAEYSELKDLVKVFTVEL